MSEYNWEYVIEKGGSYFERAKYLGLSLPPRCFVDKQDGFTKEEELLIADYHSKFKDAEADASLSFGAVLMMLSKKKQSY